MYSYIVVDDEMLIRKGLIGKINSITSMQFHCVGEAANGRQGMELVREQDPHIIITDMKMNQMNGIEFLEALGEEYPEKPVIVISGYKDYNYLKKAIEKRVIGYVLKPFSVEEIEKQLLDAVSRIQQKQNLEELREKVDSLEQKKNEEILRTIVLEPWNEMLEEETLKKGYQPEELFLSVYLYIQESDSLRQVERICQNLLPNETYYCFENPAFKKQYFVLIKMEAEYSKKYTVLLKRLTQVFLTQVSDKKVYIFYTDQPQLLSRLNKTYQQSELQIRHVSLGLQNGIWRIYGRKYERVRFFSGEQIQTIFRNIKYHKEDTRNIMNRFFADLTKQTCSLDVIGEACRSLIEKVNSYAVQENVETDDIMNVFYHRYLFCDNTDKIKNEISGYVTLIMNSIEMKVKDQADLLEQIETYILDHYHQRLTLQQISSCFYITPASCSNLMKRKFGQSFNEYISEIRIEKAKELLTHTNLSIDQISEEIGYTNPKYFFKIFKKMVLCTPLEYRKQSR
ncbi:response regulator transcription factor [Clostridium sp. C105KSO13]|uniref:response regulator transcription factor n=1 Tax=Clostridium sp. C105KSO13 TaxID=1776045 RepID=UPI0007407622|nr:response regulator [Clostridium sp. C105KSO13]CUX17364.1 putative response regulatory protein [Clostridium sp. C105KSO13]